MIRFDDLSFTYSDAGRPALRGINLVINDGEFVLITGPSGSGKSTLCRCLNGLVPHFHGGKLSGGVEVQGKKVRDHSTKELAMTVGMVFQDPENQLVALDVEREIVFGLENLGRPRQVIARRLEESLDTLSIPHLRCRQVHGLSGGEKQKVSIAAALAAHPEILVLDEPTSELDPKGAEEVLSILSRLNDELGITVILVEHRLDRVVHLVDRLIVMHEGSVFADGEPRRLLGDKRIGDLGVGIPPIAKLVQGLNGRGAGAGDVPLTVKEGRSRLREFFTGVVPGAWPNPCLAAGDPVVEMEKVWYAYPDGPTAVRDVTLQIRTGELVALMGRNASGKTTLVKHINGLLRPTKGRVKLYGKDIRDASVAQLTRQVGFVFQNPNEHLFADTVEGEVAFVLRNLGYKDSEAKRRIGDVLARFGLERCRLEYPRSLSGGERQRVALASVLVARPNVVILDEPTRGMEEGLKRDLMASLRRHCSEGKAAIVVTHDVELAAAYADRVILMSEGSVVVDGDRREVLSQALLFSPQVNRLVQAFQPYGVPPDLLTAEEALAWLQENREVR